MKKFIALFLVFYILLLSGSLYAKERRGAQLVIEKKEGQKVKGELIAVKNSSLLLLDSEGADVSIDVSKIKDIRIVKKSHALAGLLIGGGLGALLGFGMGDDGSSNFTPSFSAGQKAKVLGVLGALIFLIAGEVEGIDDTIQIVGKSDSEIQEIVEELRKKARIKNAQ